MVKRFWLSLFLAVVVFVFSSSLVFARTTANNVVSSTGVISIPVGETDVVYTRSMYIANGQYFAVSYWTYSAAGSSDVTIQLEQSAVPPATEGASDANFTIPVNQSDIVTALTTESTWYQKSFSPIALPYLRFKITGIGSNNADNIVKIKLGIQE